MGLAGHFESAGQLAGLLVSAGGLETMRAGQSGRAGLLLAGLKG